MSWCRDVEQGALDQARNLAELPVTYKHVALMPDCHVGYGMPIGGVVACVEAVIPNAVGVDIGCGVVAVQTDCRSDTVTVQQVKKILGALREVIPVGFKHHGSKQKWEEWVNAPVQCPPIKQELDSAQYQLGTLGGGNHFMEIQKGSDGFVWLMIHSGSRNFGLKVADYYNAEAKRVCGKYKMSVTSPDLAYLPEDRVEAKEYLLAMEFALRFAKRNRALMMERMKDIAALELGCGIRDEFNIHHNYCRKERHFGRDLLVHRKGATSAVKGERGIIPGSMGTPSYIVRGMGSEDSFMSSSHGAGRRMGRNEACRRLTVEECDKAMKGVVYGRWGRGRKGEYDLSEAPQAYKDIDQVMDAQADLVETTVKLQPLGVIKG